MFHTNKNLTVDILIVQAKVIFAFALFKICCCFSPSRDAMACAQVGMR